MWSFYRRRTNLLITSANIISPIFQQSSSSSRRLHVYAGKNITCSSSFSVFSHINVASISKPTLPYFYQRSDYGRRFYHPNTHDDKEQNHKQFVHKLRKAFDSFCLVLSKNNIVPYSNRIRLIVFPIKMSIKMIDYVFKMKDSMLKSLDSIPPEEVPAQIAKIKRMLRVLPETDPQSVRVRWILKDITDALYKDLKKNGVKAKYLDGLNWEILVMPELFTHICLVGGGKILISSRLLRNFTTDAEVAIFIGHEVAHMVAGHIGERFPMSPLVWLMLVLPRLIFTYVIPIRCVAEKIQDLPFRPLRMHEREADYIGMILISLAGYHPQVAPFVYLKVTKLYPKSDLSRTHPSGEERSRMLYQRMEEAQAIYKEVEASNWVVPRTVGGLCLLQKDSNESSTD